MISYKKLKKCIHNNDLQKSKLFIDYLANNNLLHSTYLKNWGTGAYIYISSHLLGYAIFYGANNIVKYLLEKGAKPNYYYDTSATIYLDYSSKHASLYCYIIFAIDRLDKISTGSFIFPCHMKRKSKSKSNSNSKSKSKGFNFDNFKRKMYLIIDLLIKYGAIINYNFGILYHAIKLNDPILLELLINNGVDINSQVIPLDFKPLTLLDYVIDLQQYTNEDYSKVFKLLICNGINLQHKMISHERSWIDRFFPNGSNNLIDYALCINSCIKSFFLHNNLLIEPLCVIISEYCNFAQFDQLIIHYPKNNFEHISHHLKKNLRNTHMKRRITSILSVFVAFTIIFNRLKLKN
jgi:hypothetical protein